MSFKKPLFLSTLVVIGFLFFLSPMALAKKHHAPKKPQHKDEPKRTTQAVTKKAAVKNTGNNTVKKPPYPSQQTVVITPISHPSSGQTLTLNSGYGFQTLHRVGFTFQAQIHFPINTSHSLFMGPDVTYTLFSPGEALQVAIGIWKEWLFYENPRMSALVGLSAGPAFTNNLGTPPTSYAVLLDISLVQQLDDLVSVKAQFRPGLLAGDFTNGMTFQIVFKL